MKTTHIFNEISGPVPAARHRNPDPALKKGFVVVGTGFFAHDARVWRDDDGWRFDGPLGCAPRAVQEDGRGPYWRGPVSAQFVTALLRKARRHNFEVRVIQ